MTIMLHPSKRDPQRLRVQCKALKRDYWKLQEETGL